MCSTSSRVNHSKVGRSFYILQYLQYNNYIPMRFIHLWAYVTDLERSYCFISQCTGTCLYMSQSRGKGVSVPFNQTFDRSMRSHALCWDSSHPLKDNSLCLLIPTQCCRLAARAPFIEEPRDIVRRWFAYLMHTANFAITWMRAHRYITCTCF